VTIFKFALIRGFQNPLAIILNAIVPLALVFIPTLWEGDHPAGFGMMAMAMMSGAYTMSLGILKDKEDGAVIRILTAPVSIVNYFTQNLMAFMIPLLLQIVVLALAGYHLYEWNFQFTVAAAFAYSLFTMATVAFAFAWHAFFKNSNNSKNGFMAALMFIALLCGMIFPLDVLPGVLQYAGAVFPAYWMTRTVSLLLEVGMSVEFWLFQGIQVLFIVGFILYGGKQQIS
jgi:ABC-2 type transport system permease protein